MKFSMMTHFDPLKPSNGQKFDLENQDGGWATSAVDVLNSDTADDKTGTVRMPKGLHVDTTWRIRLNRPCAAAMCLCVR